MSIYEIKFKSQAGESFIKARCSNYRDFIKSILDNENIEDLNVKRIEIED